MEVIELGDRKIALDPKNLEFDEHSINEFLKKFAGKYNDYNNAFADAQYVCGQIDDMIEKVSAAKAVQFKMEGGSDKLVENRVDSDPEVIALMEKKRICDRKKSLISGYLKSLDRAHDDCSTLAVNVRREIEKIFHPLSRASNPE